jgi:hypothetical protein
MTTKRDAKPRPPGHLRPATARWWASVTADYELEAHHIRLLTLAGESFDRCSAAREAIARDGLTFVDKHGQPRARPEVGIERDSRMAFARLIRELALDVSEPDASRPPRIVGRRD